MTDHDHGYENDDVAKAENPFDVLIEHARAEREAGRTRSLREFTAENAGYWECS